MITLKRLIQSVFILTLLSAGHSGNCTNVTKTDTLTNEQKAFSFSIIPEINRDLKICDLVKDQNNLLNLKVSVLTNDVITERKEKEKAQKQVKTEKRRHKVVGVLRAIGEVAVLVLIIISA